ncbi:MAG: hypothetical protein ABIJ37_03370 [Pseudomonadota bacterium]
MKKLLLGTILLTLVIVAPARTMAEIDVRVGISLPPLILFGSAPDVVVLPETDNVYVVPSIGVDLFFWSGWWWRPWEGRWYRSRYYDRGWAYYDRVPVFYFDVEPGWRNHYRDHSWYNHRWEHKRIPNQELQRNWKNWQKNRYWERQRTWDIQKYRPQPQQRRQELRNQRQQQYQQRSEVRQERQRRERREQRPDVQRQYQDRQR